MKAYWWFGYTLRDGRPIPPDGAWLEHTGPLVLCKSGLHASLDPWDALTYAPGPWLAVVDLDGDMIRGDDKVCARRRRIVRRMDASKILRSFARAEALAVVHLWDAPTVVRTYLETGDESLRAAARAAAWDSTGYAARAAAAAAAGPAARAAAWDSAGYAAWAAAWAAAWDATGAAARDSTGYAAWAAAAAAAGAAAWDAAWPAARDAAWAAARQRFNAIITKECSL